MQIMISRLMDLHIYVRAEKDKRVKKIIVNLAEQNKGPIHYHIYRHSFFLKKKACLELCLFKLRPLVRCEKI